MERIIKSYRLQSGTLDKIETLYHMEKQHAENYGQRSKSRTEIVEDAVAELYVMKLDKDAGSDYLSRMNLMIADAFKLQNQAVIESLNKILKYALLSYEADITSLKYLRLDHDNLPLDEHDAADLIRNVESIFEEPIRRKVDEMLTGGEQYE